MLWFLIANIVFFIFGIVLSLCLLLSKESEAEKNIRKINKDMCIKINIKKSENFQVSNPLKPLHCLRSIDRKRILKKIQRAKLIDLSDIDNHEQNEQNEQNDNEANNKINPLAEKD